MMNSEPPTPTPPQRMHREGDGDGDGIAMGMGRGIGDADGDRRIPTLATSPCRRGNINNSKNNDQPNDHDDDMCTSTAPTTPTAFVHACTTHLHHLASSISTVLRRLSPTNTPARQTCQRLHFEAVELLKTVLRAEEADTLGKMLGTWRDGGDGQGYHGATHQTVLGLRVVWAMERWRDFERSVGDNAA